MDDRVSIDRRSPEETFSLLGNELRVDILRALAEEPDEARSFSELREAVGERDSGKFNYHIGKLTGHFIRQTDDGYELSLAGRQVVGALLAGTYTADVRMEPIEIDAPCPECDEQSLLVAYEDEHVTIECTNCEQFHNRFTFPPGAIDQYDIDELPEALDRWLWVTFTRTNAGFCPTCGGRMEGRLVTDGLEDIKDPVQAHFDCVRCGDVAMSSAALPVFFHPAVLGFFYEHGLDLTTEPTWRYTSVVDTFDTTLATDDPPTAHIDITIDGSTISATVDETATVTAVERSDNRQK